MVEDYFTVFVPLVLGLYFALLLWCRNHNGVHFDWVAVTERVTEAMRRLAATFDALTASTITAAATIRRAIRPSQ